MSLQLRRSVSLVVLALVALLAGCGDDPVPAEPTASSSPTATATVEPSVIPDPGEGAKLGFTVEERTVAGGRSYFVGVPTCVGSQGCQAWLDHPRKLIIWMHGVLQPETLPNANYSIKNIFAATGGDTIPVYAVAAGGTKTWDGDLCCTFRHVDEIGYLQDVIADVDEVAPIDEKRVGLSGASNGGLLATKAICTKPGVFSAIAIWGANWKGRCDRGPVTIRHWHGEADSVMPVDGGTFEFQGHRIEWPAADWLETRLAEGSSFELTVIPGVEHWQTPPQRLQEMFRWLAGEL